MTTNTFSDSVPIPNPKAQSKKRGPINRFVGRLGRRFRVVGQLVMHLRRTGRWWLLPMLAIFMVAALVLVLVQVIEYAAPFVYTLF